MIRSVLVLLLAGPLWAARPVVLTPAVHSVPLAVPAASLNAVLPSAVLAAPNSASKASVAVPSVASVRSDNPLSTPHDLEAAGRSLFDGSRSLSSAVDDLVGQTFLSKKKSLPFLQGLKAAPEGFPLLDRRGVSYSPAKMKALGEAYARRFKGMAFDVSFYGPLRLSDMDRPHAAFMGAFYKDGKPVGFSGYLVTENAQGELVGEVRGVYFEPGQWGGGVTDALLAFLSQDLDPALGVARQTLNASYGGRYVWAKKGFRFEPSFKFYDVDGKAYSQVQMARIQLYRFLTKHRVRVKDLTLRGKRLRTLTNLETPLDFAEVEHKDGRTLRLRPLVNEDTLGPEQDLPVGKAFMLSDNRRKGFPLYVHAQDGREFAPDAMTFWAGRRP